LLGAEGDGYRIALSNLEGGRIGIGAQAVGMAKAAYNHALEYAKTRNTFGSPIVEHQSIAFKLADMATQLQAARLMILNAAMLGYLQDYPVERIARDVRVCTLYEGTSEIQRLLISRNLEPQ